MRERERVVKFYEEFYLNWLLELIEFFFSQCPSSMPCFRVHLNLYSLEVKALTAFEYKRFYAFLPTVSNKKCALFASLFVY